MVQDTQTEDQKTADKVVVDSDKVKFAEPKASGTRYFKSSKAGLSFSENGVDATRFVPHFEKYQGDRIRVGYLELKAGKLATRVADDLYTEEISAKAFKEATTGKDSQQAGY